MPKCDCADSRFSISLYTMCVAFDELPTITRLQALLWNTNSNTCCMGLILAQVSSNRAWMEDSWVSVLWKRWSRGRPVQIQWEKGRKGRPSQRIVRNILLTGWLHHDPHRWLWSIVVAEKCPYLCHRQAEIFLLLECHLYGQKKKGGDQLWFSY